MTTRLRLALALLGVAIAISGAGLAAGQAGRHGITPVLDSRPLPPPDRSSAGADLPGSPPVPSTTTGSPTTPAASGSEAECPAAGGAAVTRAPGSGRTVALTFDDGPGADTPALLAVLRADGVHATFFVIGARAATAADVVRQTAEEGHLVGDHTWHHSYPWQVPGGWSVAYLRRELGRTNAAITAADGRPVCWFRPPGGELRPAVLPVAHDLGMRVALWSVDPRDWQVQDAAAATPSSSASSSAPSSASSSPSASAKRAEGMTDTIVRRAAAGLAQQHPVILLHDGGGDRRHTVEAVGRIIDLYRAAGYRFVRLDGSD
jgi:peptidoglycan-N-acetylglucosamine deacetylase